MKIVHINIWYSKGFGYTENMLPKALAKLGHEVHLITSNTQIYWYEPMYKEVYKPWLGPEITACETFVENNVTIHRLPHYLFCPFKNSFQHFEQFGMRGIYQLIEKLQPDVIQTQGINLMSTFYAARYASKKNIKLFTENHIHKSVFNPNNKLFKQLYNFVNPFLKIINNQTTKCFPISKDSEELCRTYYKVPKKKITLQALGVDTDVFYYKDHLLKDSNTLKLRQDLGFKEDDIVVVYTGRFTEQKNPICLAETIHKLNKDGYNFKGLFIGKGSDAYIMQILQCSGCVVLPFMPSNQLPAYYWASDIGVWPSQESMSQLDALACGLPLILSDKIEVIERVEGCGFTYIDNDRNDLYDRLKQLMDSQLRQTLGVNGSEKIRLQYSWDAIAKTRVKYYQGDVL